MTPAKDVKVLVVDDNPLILDLLMKGLAPHCEAHAASDSTDALLKIIDEQPDLVVSDFRMPGLDGRQLYEKVRARQQTKSIPFIFLASRGDVEEKLRPLVDNVEEFITKPFFLNDFVTRAKKVIDRLQLEKLQKRAVRPGVIQGRLEEMSILDLMQSLEMGQKSCRLTVRRADETAELFFSAGQCADARLGSIEGEDAVYQVVRWPDGEFEIDFSGAPSRTTVSRSTTGLLMEALRLMDEGQRDTEDSPDAAHQNAPATES
ncbi:MAG TPA: response regulator [Candidatus Acidoferrales bacterium]|jgi:CheY-like chemotaxis protein|nr:response regulator [Candidatus Acidoferrales bacterium]